jgi:hypothetical protein
MARLNSDSEWQAVLKLTPAASGGKYRERHHRRYAAGAQAHFHQQSSLIAGKVLIGQAYEYYIWGTVSTGPGCPHDGKYCNGDLSRLDGLVRPIGGSLQPGHLRLVNSFTI